MACGSTLKLPPVASSRTSWLSKCPDKYWFTDATQLLVLESQPRQHSESPVSSLICNIFPLFRQKKAVAMQLVNMHSGGFSYPPQVQNCLCKLPASRCATGNPWNRQQQVCATAAHCDSSTMLACICLTCWHVDPCHNISITHLFHQVGLVCVAGQTWHCVWQQVCRQLQPKLQQQQLQQQQGLQKHLLCPSSQRRRKHPLWLAWTRPCLRQHRAAAGLQQTRSTL